MSDKINEGALSKLVQSYNKMTDDPKAYAEKEYSNNVKYLGKPYGGNRDARTKATKGWNITDQPV